MKLGVVRTTNTRRWITTTKAVLYYSCCAFLPTTSRAFQPASRRGRLVDNIPVARLALPPRWSSTSSLLPFAFAAASNSGSTSTPAVTTRPGTVCWERSASTSSSTTTAETEISKVTGTTATTTNPVLQQDDLPKFHSIETKDFTPAIEELLSQLEHDFVTLESKLKSNDADADVDFDHVLPEIERMQFGLGYAWGVAGHLNGVKNSDELRAVYEQNQPKIVQVYSKFEQSRPVYNALNKIQTKWNNNNGKGEDAPTTSFRQSQQLRAVENNIRSMKLGGVGLQEGTEQERFNEIKMRLAKLSTDFSNNVMDATKAFSETIEDPSMVASVPESARGMWANAHAQYVKSLSKDKKGDDSGQVDAAKGPWRITLDLPSFSAAMSHLPNRALRETIYNAWSNRASEFDNDTTTTTTTTAESETKSRNNLPLMYENLQLKAEMASMLGFNNYAELSLASKMAPDAKSVVELQDLIASKALAKAEQEMAEIVVFAQQNGGEDIQTLEPWDIAYWSERLKEQKFALTEEETLPYFALPAVLDGMFSLVERIFNVKVSAADGEAEVWHPDVRFFKVFDTDSNRHMASFYLDPYSRPENKQGGAWMDDCIGKSEVMKRDVPVAYLTCNGSPPVGKTPSLMTFYEVETLFHEFGHGLQHMLTEATVADVAGINGIEWDAVELPSQFMENWCYDRSTLYGFAKHWETGEPMPDEMFEKLLKQKTFNAGIDACKQMYLGLLDMELHSNFDAVKGANGESESIFDVQRRMAEKYNPLNLDVRPLTCFLHIFSGGSYAAGYYSYVWAEVMSADAFSLFEEVGLEKDDEVRRVGRRFRDTVLSLGGGIAPMEVFKRFRGRDPTPDALLRHRGLLVE